MFNTLSHIEMIPLRFVNAYVIRGERSVLVDTGFPGMADTILQQLQQRGIAGREISLILLTHGHPDHAGSAAELQRRLQVPVAIHPLEAEWMRRGRAHIPRPIRPFGYFVKAITRPDIPSFEPDLLLEEGMDLKPYGVEGQIVHTPGHSPGSISILHPTGVAIVGDVMAGSLRHPERALYPFLAEDMSVLHRSIQRLLQYPIEHYYFGHGFPAHAQAVRQRFVDLSASAPVWEPSKNARSL
ncbi:MAG TPA: MBL fold metallo-hydrolase [Ktedonobacteraceae bacterium]|nr:MBL fold metallo-hydrolase [Ktedonobacteraceae bacterium]